VARTFNPTCWECSQLSVDTARQFHGESGDGCWNEKTCHRRRSHYRHRADNNQKRKAHYATTLEPHPQLTTTVQAKPKAPPIALLYLYREPRKDAHLHAIAISVWQGDQKLEDVPATHCMGMTNGQIRSYLQEVIAELNPRYGIKNFEPEIRYDPKFCPIHPCPLQPPAILAAHE
jgi:hypothetical protein